MIPRRAIALLALAPILLGAADTGRPVPETGPPVPESGRLEFVIKRDGDPIGSHVVTFRREKDQLLVDTKVSVAVRILFITVYRFEKSSRETWRGGRVVAYRADTDDDGNPVKGRVVPGPEGLVAEGPKGRVVAPSGTMISGYWNVATVKQTALIDSEDVTLVPITVRDGEPADIEIDGRRYQTRHYRIIGELARELWYGPDGLLVKMRAIASDGSVIDTDRR